MNKPIQLALAALALCAAQQCSAALPLSFPVARDWLYERSDKLKASEEQVQSKRETQKSLETLGGPTVTLQAMQIAGQKKIDIDKSIPNPLAGTLPIQLPGSFSVGLHEKMSLNGPRVAATATWPIYTGGKISAMQDASKYAVDEAVAQKRADSEDLDAQLAGYYFGTQLALSIEKLQKDMLHHQDRELAKAKKFEKQGMISKIERMSVQVQRDNRNREYLKAKDNAKVARLQLARLLRDEEFGKLTTPLFVLNRPLEPLKYWVDTALASNPQIAVIQAKSVRLPCAFNASILRALGCPRCLPSAPTTLLSITRRLSNRTGSAVSVSTLRSGMPRTEEPASEVPKPQYDRRKPEKPKPSTKSEPVWKSHG
jgi:hypothetical protein